MVNPAKYGAYYVEKDECPALHVFLFKIGTSIFEIFGDPNNITALATIAIACFTATLWWSTRSMQRATLASLDLVKDEFVASHRPRLVVRAVHYTHVLTANSVVKMRFVATNIGDTEATIMTVGAKVIKARKYIPEIPGPFPKLATDTPALKSGYIADWNFDSDLFLTPGDLIAIQARELQIFCVGYIQYSDQIGSIHMTGFGRQYDAEREGFFAIDHATYEFSY